MVIILSMSRFKFFNIIDSIVISLIVFLITFVVIQFLIINLVLSLILSIILSVAILMVAKFLITKKTNNKIALSEDKINTEIYNINFKTYSDVKKLSFVKNFIEKSYSPKIVGKHIDFVKDNEKHTMIVEMNEEKITENFLYNLLKTYLNKTQNLIIVCNNYDDTVKETCNSIKNIKIKFIDKYEFYLKCKENNLQIIENIKIIKNKLKIKDIFKNFFNITHFKGFFISGLIMLFTSFIVPFRIYYLIFGIILLIFSLICKFNKFIYNN